jgi:antitoxin component of RelBE/YafQ-DinJ toxin-antitoxin module
VVKESRLLFLDFVRTLSGMGRPPKSGDKAMAARLEIRVDPAEKAAYVAAARAAGMECSDWIRLTLNAAAKGKPRKRATPDRNRSRQDDVKKTGEK